jgi:mannose-6-phosphate isomerase
MKLGLRPVEKPWGQLELPAGFPETRRQRIGEIWFEDPAGSSLPLLVKYIFTSERLSVQVHPNDEQARAIGFPNGKSECWYIVDAEPEASLGLGLKEACSPERLRDAALDGSIEHLMDWVPVAPGDFFYVPAGTVHAIGAGVSLVEIQQPSDITYRLYDYGRPRELHLEAGLAVAQSGPYPRQCGKRTSDLTEILVESEHFMVTKIRGKAELANSAFEGHGAVIPLNGWVGVGAIEGVPGECLWREAGDELSAGSESSFLLAIAR